MRFLTLLMSLIVSTSAMGSEGFQTDMSGLPEALKGWPERTFMVFSETTNKSLGTAFLVHSDSGSMHFATARHVLRHCAPPAKCSLRYGTPWDSALRGQEFASKETLAIQEMALYSPKNGIWSGTNDPADLAYIRTGKNKNFKDVDIQTLGNSLRPDLKDATTKPLKHFILGYPYLKARYSISTDPASQIIQLRLSQGEDYKPGPLLKNFNTKNTQHFLLYTNADSLGGNSGGPVIDESGKLIGVLTGGPSTTEYSSNLLFSYVVPVDDVRKMVGEILLRRLKTTILCETILLK